MKNFKEFVASVMIVLMITLPAAAAQELTVSQFSGQNGATGFAKPKDALKIQVLAQIPGEDIIDNQQLRVYIDESFSFFDSCAKEQNSQFYRCTFDDPDFESYRTIPFAIELRNDDGRKVANRSVVLAIDNLAPVIKEFKAEPLVTTGSVAFTYSVEDYGLVHGNPEGCSGVKEVLFVQNGQTLVAELGASGVCAKSRTVNYLLNQSGNVCMKVRDFLGQENPAQCKDIEVDKSAPEITRLSIVDAQGNTLSHVHEGEQKLATVSVQITDESQVNRNEVAADFGQVSSQSGFVLPSAVSGNVYIWRNIPVRETSNCKIAVKAKDILGNAQNVDFPCTMTSDNTPPTIKGIAAQALRDGIPLYGKGTYLAVEFEDKDDQGGIGAGFEKANAFADLASLGLGKFVKAQSCAFDSSWKCSWLLSAQGLEEKEYEIAVSASDDLDNAMATLQKFTIVYDNTPPVTPSLVQKNILKGEQTGSPDAPVEGNYVQFIIRSQGFTQARANFGDLGGEDGELAKSCVALENSKETECTFEHRIDFAGPYTALIGFTFTDDAGNSVGSNASVDIFGLENQSSATYWKADIGCTPELIDRATASIISPYVSCKIALKSQRKDISPLVIQGPQNVEECSGPGASSLEDVYLTNNAAGSKEPFLVLKLSARNYEVDNLNITCPISILSKSERKVNQSTQGYVAPLPQTLPVKLSLQFYNLPQKDMYGEVEKQIKDAMDDGLANQKWLGSLRKFLHYAEILCQIKTILTTIIGALYTVTVAVKAIGESLTAGGVTAPAGAGVSATGSTLCQTEEISAGMYKSVVEVLDEVCSVINCNAIQGGKSEWSVPGVTGGGAPWCNNVNEFVSQIPGLNDATQSSVKREGQNAKLGQDISAAQSLNVKDSLFWSTICMCLPGIVYNLEKLRQVQCFKAVCLHDEVKTQGYPVSYCNEMHQFLICQYVVGQIWATIPFSQFFDRLTNMVIDIITNPVALFTTIIGAVCESTCFVPNTAVYAGCALFKTTSTIAEAVASFTHMAKTKGFFQTPPDGQYCKRMEDIKDEMEEQEKGESG